MIIYITKINKTLIYNVMERKVFRLEIKNLRPVKKRVKDSLYFWKWFFGCRLISDQNLEKKPLDYYDLPQETRWCLLHLDGLAVRFLWKGKRCDRIRIIHSKKGSFYVYLLRLDHPCSLHEAMQVLLRHILYR